MQNQEISEKESIIKIQNGEVDYFEILVKKYSKILYFYTKKKVSSGEDVKDIVQVTFINAYKAIDRFDYNKRFYPFLFTILKNEIAQFYRKNKKHLQLNEEIMANNSNSEEKMLDLSLILNNLRKEYREVLKYYYIEGLSYKEIAEKLNRPLNTIKTLLRRAKLEAKVLYEK